MLRASSNEGCGIWEESWKKELSEKNTDRALRTVASWPSWAGDQCLYLRKIIAFHSWELLGHGFQARPCRPLEFLREASGSGEKREHVGPPHFLQSSFALLFWTFNILHKIFFERLKNHCPWGSLRHLTLLGHGETIRTTQAIGWGWWKPSGLTESSLDQSNPIWIQSIQLDPH